MKKRIFLLLAVLLCLTLAVALASCNDDGTVCQHRDADDNALCDKCGESYTDGTDITPPACEHRDADDNALCDKCGESYTDATDNAIGFKTLTVNGNNVFGKVSNATTTFSFLSEVSVSGNATFKVFSDLECKDNIESKTTSLAPGDNIFYILEYVGGEVHTLYTVTIRRKPMYTVTFDTADGTAIPAQTVEEDTIATRPADPTRTGYTFTGWAYDFTAPVTGNVTVLANWQGNPYTVTYDVNGGALTPPSLAVTCGESYTLATPTRVGYTFAGWYKGSTPVSLTGTWAFAENTTLVAEWTANSGIPYKVEHYTENLDGTWALQDTDNLFGTSGSEVTPAIKSYTGFTAPARQTVTVAPDGTLVVRYEYTRNSYTITFVTNGGDEIIAQNFKYGTSLADTLPIPVRTGYTFGGWFTNVSLTAVVTTVPANNTTVYAYWAEENKAGDFRYSGSTITDYQVSDTSVVIPAYIGGNPVTSIGDSAFYNCKSLTAITIPAGVISIGSSAFENCTGLTSITIPASVISIGNRAFYGCTDLTSITIPASMTSIRDQVFYRCTGLTSITIPSNVTSIGSSAFYSCTGLTSITIPASVTSIGSSAFYNCYKLIEVYNLSALDIQAGNSDCGNVGYYAKNVYTATTGSSKLFTDSNGYIFCVDGNTRYLMGYTGSDTVLTLPETCNGESYEIYRYAFYNCKTLTSITIPAGVTSIGSYAFEGCVGLTSVTFGENSQLTSIGDYEFYGCTGLTSITIPASVTSIGSSAFRDCTGLTSITIPASVTQIGDWAFCYCTSLTSITIPASVTSIGDYEFYGCTGLKSVSFSENSQLTSIEEFAFRGCTGLVSITIPDSVTSIGSSAFRDCTGLTSVTIPASVTSIGSCAFYGCTGLASVTFANTNGWWRASSSTATSGTAISVSSLANPAMAAAYLTTTYYNYYWKRG